MRDAWGLNLSSDRRVPHLYENHYLPPVSYRCEMADNENGQYARVTVSIRADQKAWFDAHPQINVSAFARDAFDAEIRKQDGKANGTVPAPGA